MNINSSVVIKIKASFNLSQHLRRIESVTGPEFVSTSKDMPKDQRSHQIFLIVQQIQWSPFSILNAAVSGVANRDFFVHI